MKRRNYRTPMRPGALIGLVPTRILSSITIDEWIDKGSEALVESSNVAGIRYLKREKILEFRFKKSGVYVYVGVPEQVARDAFNTSSMGEYEHYRLRGKYTAYQLR